MTDLTRLVLVRMSGHLGDGVVQAALLGVVLFSPERRTTPGAIAAGFAVLLLPYSLVGPSAAAALDRWDRRAVLLLVSLLRVLLTVTLAAGLLLRWIDTPAGSALLFGVALAFMGTGRLQTTGVSAALPHVAERSRLVGLNTALATAGSMVTAGGALVAVLVVAVVGSDSAAAGTVLIATLTALVAALLTRGFARQSLGPGQQADAPWPAALVGLAGGLTRGAAAALRAPRVAVALAGLTAHRAVFGVNTVVLVLVLREAEGTVDAGVVTGLGGFGLVVGAVAVGMLLAAPLTPWLLRRIALPRAVQLALVVLAVVQLALVAPLVPGLLTPAGVLLGLSSQVVKLSGDAAMLLDVPTERRAQVFAFQDLLFNAVFVLAMVAVVPLVPAAGQARGLLLAVAGAYVAVAVGISLPRRPTVPDSVQETSRQSA